MGSRLMHLIIGEVVASKYCELEVYNFDEIIEYISVSKSKAIAVLEEINLGGTI